MLRRLILVILITLFYNKSLLSAEGMPQFNAASFPSQLFWLVTTFVLLYVCITFLILPRIRNNIRLRKNKVANDIERAQLLKEQIEKTVNEYDTKIAQAKSQASENLNNAIEKANKDFITQLESVKQKLLQKISNAENDMKNYKKNLEKDINKISVNISSIILEKVIDQGLDKNEIYNLNKVPSRMEEI